MPKFFVKRTLSRVKKMMANDKSNPIVIGNRTYMIDDNEVRVATTASETCVKWDNIAGVAETADYIYLMIATAQAFVIPKKKVAETYIKELKAIVEQQKNIKL